MFQSDLLKGRRYLVTGGGTGLGRAMAERFLRLGAEVAICGRRKLVLDEAAAQMAAETGGTVRTFGVDIRDAASVDAMADELFATGGLDGLVNNAAGNFISPTESLSPRAFDAIANIVFHGTFYVTHAVGRRWIAQAKAAGGWAPPAPMKSVMSIIVTWVENGGPYVVPSAMSKAGIAAMTRSKQHNPQKRPGEMRELQNLATFLMAPGMCDWLTGELIHMDGGNHLATGGNFYALREWSDEQWREARERIEAQNAKDRAQR
jgi:NAD(P)-dependent dehydrogenase (short-subunit alcohol dehydrogenase family)